MNANLKLFLVGLVLGLALALLGIAGYTGYQQIPLEIRDGR